MSNPETATAASLSSPQQILRRVQGFLARCGRPALVQDGEEALELAPDRCQLEPRGPHLMLHAWDARRSVARKILAVLSERPGAMVLQVEQFPKRRLQVQLLDLNLPRQARAARCSLVRAAREHLRLSLKRQFPGWDIRKLSMEPDLEHSLSAAYARAFVVKGTRAWAAIAAGDDESGADGILTFGLVWLDYLRRRHSDVRVEGLALFVSQGRELSTCLRLRYLNPRALRSLLYVRDGRGMEEAVDPIRHGNLQTHLEPVRSLRPDSEPGWARSLRLQEGVESIDMPDGGASLRVRGLEFARWGPQGSRFGLGAGQEARDDHASEIASMARELARLRSPDATDRNHTLYLRCMERWLESQVRHALPVLDASLRPTPLYGQVPSFAGGDRAIADLLAVDYQGRMAVLELKASADPHLPLQALDYWMRVRWHAANGDFSRAGYFPGIPLSTSSPRLLLVAPALEFHPTTETVLRYLSPELEVERIGLGLEWQKEVRVVFRLSGACAPC